MAGIISQKTNLKSLRYGKDRPGGGSSNQPYVSTRFGDGLTSSATSNPTGLKILDGIFSSGQNPIKTGGTDFLLRGGTSAISRAAKDASRLSQMFLDFKSPNGIGFAAKQNILSRSGVKTQASGLFLNEGAYLPTSTILQAAGNAFGTHLLKQGLNPGRNTSADAGATNNKFLNLLGVGDTVQSIIQDVGGLPVYAQTVKSDQPTDDNRLVQLKNSKIGSDADRTQQGIFGDSNFINLLREINPFKKGQSLKNIAKTIFSNKTRKLGISLNNGEILRYGGGPGSVLGVGQTSIKRYVYSTTSGFSADVSKGFFNVLGSGQGIESRHIGNSEGSTVSDFRALLNKDPNATRQNILSNSPDYTKKNIENRVNLGDPGRRNKNLTSYTAGLGALDKITSFPLYQSEKGDHEGYRNDLVKFSIGIIDNDFPDQKVYIHFRAFLDSMEDQYNAEWNGFRYMGRGENFYRYNGFTRTISLGWTIAAQSKEELIPMYQKLNFLASSLAPDYSPQGYMRGNLAVLTVGGYVFEQPGIINSINYSVPQESPWEIGISDDANYDTSVKELPHIIKVTGFSFTPIHTFVPGLQQNDYTQVLSDKKGEIVNGVSGFGKERFIALTNGRNSNYGIPPVNPSKPSNPVTLEALRQNQPTLPNSPWIQFIPDSNKVMENIKNSSQIKNLRF